MELWEQDIELNKKIAAVKLQHKMDNFFNMKETTFFDELDMLGRSYDGYSAYDPTPYKEQIRKREVLRRMINEYYYGNKKE